ncbi:TatD family hydrolase [Thermodesulfobacteriota bacterium]
MLIDSHAHLDMKAFDKDRDQVLTRALEAGLSHIITIGIDLSSSRIALKLANQYDFVYSTIGFHPHVADQMESRALKEMEGLATEPKVLAWGEIGLDFYRRRSPPNFQLEAFERQLKLADQYDLPVIIHDRDAHEETLKILKKMGKGDRKGVIHCFSGDYELAMTFIELGYYISIPGTVTYRSAFQVQDAAARIPLEYLLLETDAPFLTPVQAKTRRNEPCFVIHTARKVAQLRDMDPGVIAEKTTANVKEVFRLP